VTARRHVRAPTLLVALAVGSSLAGAACASTTYVDDATDVSATEARDPAPTTSAAIAGTAAELLPQLADAASALPQVMIDGGDDRAAAARIASLWAAVQQEVAATRPELEADFAANVRRCASAVEFNRAADADKAAANVRALVDAYLG